MAHLKKWVVGFIFNSDMDHVLLINKNRPDWQIGFLNGIGGRVRDNELSVAAMSREAKEECDLFIADMDWHYVCLFENRNEDPAQRGSIKFFATATNIVTAARTTTDEFVYYASLKTALPLNVVPPLKWLIPLSIDVMKQRVAPIDRIYQLEVL